jgi:hypothetical protein
MQDEPCEKRIERIAIHEAGHAVGLSVSGGTITAVWIAPDAPGGEEPGRCQGHYRDAAGSDLAEGEAEQLWREAGIRFNLAAPLAEELLLGSSDPLIRNGHEGEAWGDAARLQELTGAEWDPHDYVERVREEMRLLLAEFIPAIRSLADALLDRRRLTGNDAHQIISRSRRLSPEHDRAVREFIDQNWEALQAELGSLADGPKEPVATDHRLSARIEP